MRNTSYIVLPVIVMLSASCALAQWNREGGERSQFQRGGQHGNQGGWGDRQGGDRGGQHGGHSMIDKFLNNPDLKEMGLTDEQIARLKKVSEQSKAKQQKLMEAMHEAGRKQAELMSAEKTDRESMKAAAKKVGEIRTELGWIKTEELIELKEILTQEQREKIQEMRQKRFQQMQRGGQHGQQGGWGDKHGGGDRQRGNDWGDKRGGQHGQQGGWGDKRGGGDRQRGDDWGGDREEMKRRMMERRQMMEQRQKHSQDRPPENIEEDDSADDGNLFQM